MAITCLFSFCFLTANFAQSTFVTGIPADHTFCLEGAPVVLEGFNPGGKVFAGSGITDHGDGTATFDPLAAGLGDHVITYDGARWNATVTVKAGPIVALAAYANVCVNEPAFSLTGGTPTGGNYSGTGVDGSGNFDPAAAGAGTHQITYTNTIGTCVSSAVEPITVDPLPAVALAAFSDVCLAEPAFALSGGSPAGGSYSGTGVDGFGNFDPSVAGIGTHAITYTVSSGSCTNSTSENLTVNAMPTASLAGLNVAYCPSDAPVNITGTPTDANGSFSGPGIFDNTDGTAIFAPASAGVGIHTITYTYTDANGCSDSFSQDVQVGTEINITGLPAEYCVDNPDIAFISTPAGGSYTPMAGLTDNGDGTAIFSISTAGVGTHTIEYTYLDAIGCTNVSSDDILVNPLPNPNFIGLPPSICLDNPPVALTGNYGGGSFSGVGVLDNADGTGTFDPASTGVGGPFDISYAYTDANGCSATITKQTQVLALPTASISGDATICEGNSTPITITLTGTSPYNFSYTDGTFNFTETGHAPDIFIDNVAPTSDKVYTLVSVEDMNSCTNTGVGSASITVDAQVNIQIQPSDKVVCPGSNANFQVVADGVNLSYQWQKDGVNIAGATNPILTLNNVDATDVAAYQCIVTSATCGAPVTSNAVALSLYTPTSISAQPTDDYLCTGEELQLVVGAIGSGLSYQWRKEGINIADGGNISGSSTNTLIITNVTTANAGEYTCEVIGACGTVISAIAGVSIDAPIAITLQPTSTSICPGENASFSTTATGTNLTYQWYKEGIALAGETSQSLILNAVGAGDAADYSCLIGSPCGASLSTNTVALNLYTETQFIAQPSSISQCFGANASFEVLAQGSSLSYQWYKDGLALINGGDIAGATNSQVIISNIDLTDQAEYTCQISGTCGAETSLPAQLIVNDNITISTQPVSQTLCEGNNVTFSIVATGSGLTYQWQKDGADIAGATSDFINLPNVSDADEANYRCVVSNACGQFQNSDAATLIVNDLTQLTSHPADLMVCEGTNVSYTISAEGSNLSYQWYKDGAALADGGNITGSTSSNLVIAAASTPDEGEYYCQTVGDCGTDASNRAQLIVDNTISITQQPASQQACEGDNIVLEVLASGSNLTYQWQKDGVDLAGANLAQLSLNNLSAVDEADYRCIIENICGMQEVSQAATISLYDPIIVNAHPLNANLCEGDAASFSVIATGSSLTYQWHKDGIALIDGGGISGSTSSTLSISNIALVDGGVYSCQLSSSCMLVSSDPATLEVFENTLITQQPTNKSYCEGENGQFSVVAQGNNLSYQWQKDGVDIPGATNSGLSIAGLTLSDEGVYRCIVTGTCGTETSNGAQLSLSVPVSITTDPASQVICNGQSIDFNIAASGIVLSYQWRKDGIDLVDNASLSGAASANLSIDPVTTADAGVYTCLVTGACNQETSVPANLLVNENITITQQPSNIQSCENNDVSFSVLATGTGIAYQWQKDGADLVGETAPSLQLNNIGPADAGVYRCMLTGTCTSIASEGASLSLNGTTSITTNPIGKTICEGQTANFSILANGTNLSYQWKLNGIDLANSAMISGANQPDLSISPTTIADAGVYTCEIAGDCGTENSLPANLVINEAIVITDHPNNLTACPGEDANFSVNLNGTAPSYQWQLDGIDIPGATNSGYTVPNVSDANEGIYHCIITNSCGAVNSDGASLVVDESVTIATQPLPSIALCQGNNLSLTVIASGTNLVYQWQKDGSNLSNGGNISGVNSQNLDISNLSLDDDGIYNVVVIGTCASVTSDFSDVEVYPTTIVTQQPANFTSIAGGVATFSVEAAGNSLSYQWQKDGADLSDGGSITGATTPDLTLSGVAEADEGAYRCIVSGTCNTANSSPANLIVNPTSLIISHPINQVKCEEESVNFSVAADGSSHTYQWKKDGVNLSDNATVSGTGSPNLSLASTSLSDAGAYTCEVSGENSAPALLSIYQNTIITSQPTALIRCVGDNLLFSIEASGENLSYQWRKDGVDLSDGGSLAGANTETFTISSSTLSDAGDYTCFVSGNCGTANSDPANLTVYQNTSISSQPTGATICEQASHIFSIGTIGDNLNFSWTKDGNPVIDGGHISGATTANLVVSNADLSDAGAYVCTVTGNCGNLTSTIAQLQVQASTAIELQPADFTGCEGENISLSILAKGTALAYQWQKDGVDLTDGGAISGSTSPNLTITGLTMANAGSYICVITGNCGSENSQPAEIAIYDLTQITAQPSGSVVCQGEAVSMAVTATGSNLSYQWKKGSSDLVDNANITGATTANLSIASADLTDAGAYYCVISGSCGEEISNLATVQVEQQTQFTLQPSDVQSCNGQNVSFIIDAQGENLSYQWQKDGLNLTDNAFISGSNAPLLQLSGISSADAGNYRCVLTGNCGTVNSDPAQLFVYNAVQITSQPSDMVLCEGEQVSLNITANGDNLAYQWKRNGIDLIDGGTVTGAQTANLIINASTLADAGTYSCEVTGSCGNENGLPVSVQVHPATQITQQPENLNSCAGNIVVLWVQATGENLLYQWQKEGIDLLDGGNIFGSQTASLSINGILTGDAGKYRCIVTGACGSVNSEAADVAVGVLPGASGMISGPANVCQGEKGIVYEVAAIADADYYIWEVPLGIAITSGDSTRAIEVSFATNELGGAISVRGENGCGQGIASPSLMVAANPIPLSNAGADQNLCINIATLTAQDPSSGIGTWEVVNGPAIVQDVHAYNSQVSNLREGTNTLTWTVEDNGCTAVDTVRILNNSISVEAGVDETICATSVQLNASAVPIGATGSWSVSTGSASFANGNDPQTQATSFAPGLNTLRWTVTKGGCISTDSLTIDNQRPTEAYAGIDQSLCKDQTVLSGNLPSIGAGQWSVVTGSASFVDPTSNTSPISSLGQGDNILRWTISNGVCSTIDEVSLSNNQVMPDAGVDQVICSRTSSLDAALPTIGSGFWSVASGSAIFVNNKLHNTTVTGLAQGANDLVWNIDNNNCISSDTVTLVNDSPTNSDAGTDQLIAVDFTTLQGNSPSIGKGQWTLLSGSAVIDNDTVYNTGVTGLAIGENLFRWTITHNSCISSDEVLVTNFMPTSTDAGPSQTICGSETILDGNEPAFGFGEWSVIQGSANFVNNSNPKTQVAGLAQGDNILRWSVWQNGWTHDDVIITNDSPTTANAGIDKLLCQDSTSLAGNDPIIGTGLWTVISGAGTFSDPNQFNTSINNLAKGENIFKWTLTNKSCSSSDMVKIINDSPTTADAGPDMQTCGNTVSLSPNTPSIGYGEWSVLSGSANFDGNLATNLALGDNILRYTIVNKACKSFDEVTVTSTEVSTPNAGANKIICQNNYTLSANAPVIGTGLWTLQSGSALIADPTNPNTTVSNLSQGKNIFRWTITNDSCIKYDEVIIENALVEATAGIDQEICANSTLLEGNNPSAGIGTWSVVGGSGSASFEEINQPDTRVNGLDQGINILRWTITNNICVSYDEVSISNTLPTEAFAGPDQTLCADQVVMQANAPLIGQGNWTVLSGSATIADAASPNTQVSQLGFGVNTLRWTISNGTCISADEVVLTNNSTVSSNAGTDQQICADSTQLYANKPTVGQGQWSVANGSATFIDGQDHQTKVTDLGKGTNILSWTISTGTCSSTDEIIIVNNAPTKAIAGADQTVCGNTATLQANTPSVGTGTWSLVSGSAIFIDASKNNTQVSGLNTGTNTLRWTISNNGCELSDEVSIYNQLPYEADAGEDFSVCGNTAALYANDPGSGAGSWAILSGSGNFDNPTSYNATVFNLGFGANTLRWTVDYGFCKTIDEITVTNNKATVNAGPDHTVETSTTLLAASNPSAGSGFWTVVGGSGTFNAPTNSITGVRNIGAGLNTYRWSVDVNGCISFDDVQVSYKVPPQASFVVTSDAGCPPLEIYFVNNSLPDLDFTWDFDDGTSSKTPTVLHTYTEPGIYNPSLTVINAEGQIVITDTIITVHPNPEASFIIVERQVYIPEGEAVFINTSSQAENYLWEFGDGNSSEDREPAHQYEDVGIYDIRLSVWSEHNCFDSTSFVNGIEVLESGSIEFPNAFTPDPSGPRGGYYRPEDFTNDIFFPIADGVDEYHLEIFNKWGVLIFESDDLLIGWDGYYDKKLQAEGAYVWKASGTYNNGNAFEKMGTVLLVR